MKKLELEEQDIEKVIAGLLELQGKHCFNLVINIQRQCKEQDEASAPERTEETA